MHALRSVAGVRCLAAAALAAAAIPVAALDPAKEITQYRVSFWRQTEGLPQNNVKAILQTRDGYLWVGTKGGVGRFDGRRFVTYSDLGAGQLREGGEVWAMAEQGDTLWLGIFGGGLVRLRDDTLTTYTTGDGLANDFVRSLALAGDGSLWIGTETGLCRMREEGFHCLGVSDGLRSGTIRTLLVDSRQRLWVGTDAGVHLVEGGVVRPWTPPVPDLGRALVLSLAEGRDGAIWVGTAQQGLFRLAPDGTHRRYTTRDGLATDEINTLFVDRHDALWIGTRYDGVTRFKDGALSRHYAAVTSVSQGRALETVWLDNIQAFYEDTEGNLWVATSVNGLARFRDSPFTTYLDLNDNGVLSVFVDSRHRLWAGTERGLCRSPLHEPHFTCWTLGRGHRGVVSFAELDDGSVWFASDAGVSRFVDGRVETVSVPGGLEAAIPPVAVLFRDAQGGVWVPTRGGVAVRRKGRWGERYTLRDRLGREATHVRGMAEESDGTLWIGTRDNGAFRIREGEVKSFTREDGLPSDSVAALHVDDAGRVWLATRSGLSLFHDGRFDTFTTDDGLPANFFYQIVDDEQGHLWLTSGMGVYRVAAKDLLDRAARRIPTVRYAAFGSESGLLSTALKVGSAPAAVRDGLGRLWFATPMGVSTVDPAEYGINPVPPRLHVEEVIGDNKAYPARANLTIPPGSGKLEIHYTGLSFLSPDRIRFRYRLEGLDEDWVEAGTRRVAYYTNLPPRSYVFRVIACNNDGVWNEEGATLAFALQPHFYEARWFHVTVLVLLGLAVWGGYRLRLVAVRNRFAAVLAERNRIARELHDGLDQAFTAVSLQLQIALRAAREAAPHGVDLVHRLELTKSLLAYARAETRRSIVDLRTQGLEARGVVPALSQLVEQFEHTYGMTADLRVHGRVHVLSAAVENDVIRICQEAVSNAVRHGGAKNVGIDLTFGARTLQLKVRDAGRGFDVASVLSVREGHFGLTGMRERVKWLGGDLHLESSPGNGAEVRVEIPYDASVREAAVPSAPLNGGG